MRMCLCVLSSAFVFILVSYSFIVRVFVIYLFFKNIVIFNIKKLRAVKTYV